MSGVAVRMAGMEQLGLEGMPARLFSCTPSKLNTWLDCPRRYRMTYLDRPSPAKGGPWAHNSLGGSVHNALRAWWDEPEDARSVERAAAILDRSWLTEGWRDDAQSTSWRSRARTWVTGYVASLDPADEPVGVERTVSTKTRHLALSGRVDRIDDRDGELVIVDYKTGRRRLTIDDVRSSLALALYAIAAARTLRKPCHRVELHHLPTGEVLSWEHTDDTLARHLSRAEDIAIDATAAMAAASVATVGAAEQGAEPFPPKPGALCAYCDFRRHCPEGRAVSAELAPWAALGDERHEPTPSS